MEPRRAQLHVIKPIGDEAIDATNKRIRRVLNCAFFYDEAEIDPEAVAEGMIGQETTYSFPDAEPCAYRTDDVVFVSSHKVRLHLSRPLLLTA